MECTPGSELTDAQINDLAASSPTTDNPPDAPDIPPVVIPTPPADISRPPQTPPPQDAHANHFPNWMHLDSDDPGPDSPTYSPPPTPANPVPLTPTAPPAPDFVRSQTFDSARPPPVPDTPPTQDSRYYPRSLADHLASNKQTRGKLPARNMNGSRAQRNPAPSFSPAQPSHQEPTPSYASPQMTGSYSSIASHESALTSAENAGNIVIRIINCSFDYWHTLLDRLMDTGDCEGNIWLIDKALNDSLRVVSPSKDKLTCWFTVFIPAECYKTLKFIDDVYDFGRSESIQRNCFAIRDHIFARRGIDHGALVEIAPTTAHHPLGLHSIEDPDLIAMYRLTNRIARELSRRLASATGTSITIRTRYRPLIRKQIHTVMVGTQAQSKAIEWRAMTILRDLKGKPLEFNVDGRTFRLTDFPRAETAYSPINSTRVANLDQAEDALQGRKCIITNIPQGTEAGRIATKLSSRGLHFVGDIVVLNSRYTDSRIAYLQFADENTAFRAILDAPTMTINGVVIQIKATQPKKGRTLKAQEADEIQRMDTNGASDGMTKSQITDLITMVNTSSSTQLEQLHAQFKVDENESFANSVVNAVRHELSALRQDVTTLQDRLVSAVEHLTVSALSASSSALERHQALENVIGGLVHDHDTANKAIAESLAALHRDSAVRDEEHRQALNDFNLRMDMLQEVAAYRALNESPQSKHSRTQNAQKAVEDSDDSDDDLAGPTLYTAQDAVINTPVRIPDHNTQVNLTDFSIPNAMLDPLPRTAPPTTTAAPPNVPLVLVPSEIPLPNTPPASPAAPPGTSQHSEPNSPGTEQQPDASPSTLLGKRSAEEAPQ